VIVLDYSHLVVVLDSLKLAMVFILEGTQFVRQRACRWAGPGKPRSFISRQRCGIFADFCAEEIVQVIESSELSRSISKGGLPKFC
jgi:hypothetical protein